MRSPLTWPKLLQVDSGSEFRSAVKKLCDKHGTIIRCGLVGVHRDQGIVECFNRTLAERLFGYQYHRELAEPGMCNKEWVLHLPEVVKALNNEVTRLMGKKPFLAICMKSVRGKPAAPASRARTVGFEEQCLPSDALVRYLYAPGDHLEGDKRRRATDPVWSMTVHKIERAEVKSGEPVLYYLMPMPAGERRFIREELQLVPVDTEALLYSQPASV